MWAGRNVSGSDILRLDSRIEVRKSKVKKIIGERTVEQLDLEEEQLIVDGVFILRDTLPAEQHISGLEMDDAAIKVNLHFLTRQKPRVCLPKIGKQRGFKLGTNSNHLNV